MMNSLKKGFTLIELLVVITIIGILATGAVTTFTSQIQKARDTTRISDVKALQGGVEQFYQDDGTYPDKWATFSGVTIYVQTLPSDPKSGESSWNASFDYMYNVSPDSNTIDNQEYEISTHFEQTGNIDSKAGTDNWNDPYRLEVWIDIDDSSGSDVKPTLVANDVTANALECVAPGGGWTAACATAANPMLIKK